MYYLNSRFYDPEICRFISADIIEVLAADQGNLLQYNLYAYCLNNPVNREDIEGNISILTCAMLGGAVAGGIISAMSHAVNCSMNGQEITAKEMAAAVLFGALTGAAGGAIGALKMSSQGYEFIIKGAYSLVVGFAVGINIYDGGTNSIENAIIVGGSAALGTFAGSLIDTDGVGKVGTIFANYATGLTTGTPTEIISTTGQQMNSKNNVKSAGKNSGRTQNKKSTTCRISSGTTTADYFRQQYNS